ncbi:MAG: AAC(3) family N-acetyltransferase [Clostridia bacterium]|nr:AAC(3) family N-acetyltransferase [Clostridia bacterium]
MINLEHIRTQLQKLGVPIDKPVIVHVSLRAVGKIDGGGKAMLDVLIEHVTSGGGVLCIPTHTWANFEKNKDIILDLTDNKTCIGTLPDLAVQDKRAVRTLNPTHSVAVFGDKDKVKEFIGQENQCITPTSPNGCYGNLFKLNGKVLLIGVGQEKNTYIHCVEEMFGITDRLSKEPVKMRVKNVDGSISEKPFHYMNEEILDVSVNFPKYERAFRYHGAIVDGVIGNAKVQLCDAVLIKKVMELIRKRSNEKELLFDNNALNFQLYKNN